MTFMTIDQLGTISLFSLSAFAVIATPGPTTLLALSNGASYGMRHAAFGIAGAALSDLILIAAVAAGLGAVLAASELLFSLVKWLGVAYLLWLAVSLWRADPKALAAPSPHAPGPTRSPAQAFTRSLVVALSNPKGLLFFSAFLPQFINTATSQAAQYLVLACIFTLIDVGVMLCYALGGYRITALLSARGLRLLNRTCASILATLAAGLSLYRRQAA